MAIRAWMITFSLGIITCGFMPQLSQSNLYLLLLIPLILSFRLSGLLLTGAFLSGFCWFIFWAQNGVEQLLPKSLEKKDIWVQGTIISLPQHNVNFQRFEFKITKLCPFADVSQCHFSQISEQSQKILLNSYQNNKSTPAFIPGQHWQFKVRLKRPHGFMNPGGFDYQGWLMAQKITAVGYIRSANNQLLQNPDARFSFQSLRYKLRTQLNTVMQQQDQHYVLKNINLIKALTIGDRYNITDGEWKLFTATGTNHLIVISGLHVGLVTLMIYHLSVKFLSIFTASLLCIPAQRSGAAFAALAAFFYAGLAGFSLPAQRAFIMVAVFTCSQLLYRHSSPLNSYFLALCLVLILSPLAPQSSGIWLSFGAVGVLLSLSNSNKNLNHSDLVWWQKSFIVIKSQLLLSIGLLPIMIVFYQQQSLVAPLINIIAIPFVGFIVVPLCLLGLLTIGAWPWLAGQIFILADFTLTLFKAGLRLVAELSHTGVVELPHLSWFAMLVVIIGCLLIIFSGKWRYKSIGALCLLPLILSKLIKPHHAIVPGEFSLTVLDVGQGLAVVVQTSQHTLIYDTGPIYSDNFDAGNGILLPYLRHENINKVDTIIISHGDNDHAGGLGALTPVYPQAHYLAPDTSIFPDNVDAQTCHAPQQWQWEGVTFMLIHPNLKEISGYSRNNSSCVLKITAGQNSVLLAGDIERRVERRLLRNSTAILASTILIAPHHGSNTSSTRAFINAVNPDYTIFSSGYLSRFNHPHPLVTSRYQQLGTIMLNTSTTGAIKFMVNSNEALEFPQLYRLNHKRYWSSL